MQYKYISILIILLGLTTIASVAQTWDATKDFGPLNPNSAWSCGYGITGTSFTLDPIYNPHCTPPEIECWTAQVEGNTPSVPPELVLPYRLPD
jgi:hypothetical protein